MSAFEAAIGAGGVVLFPSDTVYGLACDPLNLEAVERLYRLKGRAPEKAAAVMFFALEAALAALPEIGAATRSALRRLMPGGVTALLPNPDQRFPLACRADPETLGLRVISVRALQRVRVPVLQSSANPSGGPEARRLVEVDLGIRAGATLEVDGGELPGVPSTVIDLRGYEDDRGWTIVRQGLVPATDVAAALGGR
jgi:L-threonylcarbamoyladenylate synthase